MEQGRDRKAVALRYSREEQGAPHVVARGRGRIAERILALARENGVPVQEDPDLVQLLAACDPGEEIPVEVYSVVAELLTYLHRLNRSQA
jgi:flagellar biosynthesis protein